MHVIDRLLSPGKKQDRQSEWNKREILDSDPNL